jgi:hypothetical protein
LVFQFKVIARFARISTSIHGCFVFRHPPMFVMQPSIEAVLAPEVAELRFAALSYLDC